MKKVYLFLADGFEEVEALTTADILVRAGAEVTFVKVTGGDDGCMGVKGSHGFEIKADIFLAGGMNKPSDAVEKLADGDCVVLPGGQPGTRNLAASEAVKAVVNDYNAKGKIVCAICAAPTVLGGMGLLKGRTATCFPGCEAGLTGAEYTAKGAEVDGNIITGKSMGSAVTFGLAVAGVLLGKEAAAKVEASIYRA